MERFRTKMILTALLMVVSLTLSAQKRHQLSDAEKEEQYRTEVREAIGLDYSMPDYSINKVDAQVMGTRLAKIVEYFCANYQQNLYDTTLSHILDEQIKGIHHSSIKSMKFSKVTKKGDEITMYFDTLLEPNNLNIKHTDLIFSFVDGVSESKNVNDLFMYMTRYANMHEKK